MDFRITGLDPEAFAPLYGLDEAGLIERGVERVHVVEPHAAPCRITLDDAEPGQTVLLLNHEHQPAPTPYRSRHAIFVREGAARRFDAVNEIPPALARRTLSLRAFDAGHRMIDAELAEGADLPAELRRLLADPNAAYVHIHYARRGCYAALAERA